MKKFLSLLLAVLIFGMQSGCEKSPVISNNTDDKILTSTDKNDSIEKQIKVIADNIDVWKIDDELENWGYAVTDINNNGRLEIISSTCQGSGLFSDNNVWEVNENMDGLVKCNQNINETDSQADIMSNNPVPAYSCYDGQKNIYYLIFSDLTRNGPAEYYENLRSWSLQDNEIIEDYLAYKTTVYADGDSNDVKITCKDANGNPITEEEYNNIADKLYSRLKKLSVNINWIYSQHLADLDKDKLYHTLYDSYKNFIIVLNEN